MRENEHETIIPQFVNPQAEYFAAARKLDLSVEAINRARNPHLYTEKRHLTESLAYRLANPDLSLDEIARNSHLSLESLQEDLKSAHQTFQWAAEILSGDNNFKEESKG